MRSALTALSLALGLAAGAQTADDCAEELQQKLDAGNLILSQDPIEVDPDWLAWLAASDHPEDHAARIILTQADRAASEEVVSTVLARWPTEPLLLETALGICASPPQSWCGPEHYERWHELQPDRLEPYLRLAQEAFDSDDPATGWQWIISAARHDAGPGRVGRIAAAFANAAYGYHPDAAGLGDALVISGLGFEMALAMPSVGTLSRQCSDATSEAQVKACVALVDRFSRHGEGFAASFASALAERIEADHPGAIPGEVRTRIDETGETAQDLLSRWEPDLCTPGALVDYLHRILAYGELEAIRRHEEAPEAAPTTGLRRPYTPVREDRAMLSSTQLNETGAASAEPSERRAEDVIPGSEPARSWLELLVLPLAAALVLLALLVRRN